MNKINHEFNAKTEKLDKESFFGEPNVPREK